jgi:hypothetical protein
VALDVWVQNGAADELTGTDRERLKRSGRFSGCGAPPAGEGASVWSFGIYRLRLRRGALGMGSRAEAIGAVCSIYGTYALTSPPLAWGPSAKPEAARGRSPPDQGPSAHPHFDAAFSTRSITRSRFPPQIFAICSAE